MSDILGSLLLRSRYLVADSERISLVRQLLGLLKIPRAGFVPRLNPRRRATAPMCGWARTTSLVGNGLSSVRHPSPR